MITKDFVINFKNTTENRWRTQSMDPALYGFQFQKGTRWNPGLSEKQISRYERDLGISFPIDLRLFFAHLNGTDLETLNVYGNSGEPYLKGVGVYSYPNDLDVVKERIADIVEEFTDVSSLLFDVGLGKKGGNLLPFYNNRYVVCGSDYPDVPVLSVEGNDAIVYATDFRGYLEKEFLRDG
ncbi:MAG: hypothetical protein U0835_23180 [Isosphaeraceae bacterium]